MIELDIWSLSTLSILDHSMLTSKEYDKKQRVEWYLFADEAKEKGFIDQIIGVDCDIDTVV